ncbi:MAG: aspartate carbamoyltransferase catalytic subunit [Candidatus Kapabacteria bacterium]|nr:aspartate carbamoyltransferase catalytic subunit [Candidatus Kapabacteria bacterium]
MTVPHLLSTNDLSVEDIIVLLDDAASFVTSDGLRAKRSLELGGKRLVLAFFEPSTRTRLSFETAADRLGASSIFFQTSGSSVEKGETMRETIMTIQAMGFDAIILRHATNGIHAEIASYSKMSVINAGEGSAQHPTQALLDASALRERFGSIEGKRVAIVGDLRHSRVARSTADVLLRLGAEVAFCAPDALAPQDHQFSLMTRFPSLDEVLPWADVVYLLRIQRERISDDSIIDPLDYRRKYAFTIEHANSNPNVVIMHPGPVGVGVEIDEAVLDLNQCLIHRQVTHGVAMRMAVLRKLLNH